MRITAAPQISVLLPTYRQPESLVLTLRDLSEQEYPHHAWQLVVIDDGSCDASGQIALMTFSQQIPVTVKRLVSGGMYCHAMLLNELVRLAHPATEVYVHVEDVRLRSNFLLQHAKWHRTNSHFLVTGPMCEGPVETFDPSACARWRLMEMSGTRCDAYRCCFQAVYAKSMSYSRALLNALGNGNLAGIFDESMTGWGYQETEFAYRAEASGATCVYDARCGVYHPAHNVRDELNYREIDRAQQIAEGSRQNTHYLCRKHGLPELPQWRIGEPLSSPPLLLVNQS